MIRVRPERSEDIPQVRVVNLEAFGQPTEADLVDKLRQSCPDALFLIAEEDEKIVGHIAFTPAVIESRKANTEGMGLAPMAVLPGLQRQGIGSKLVREGLDILRKRGCPFVIVLGHPEYYPKFGFEPASRYDIKCQWQGIPDEAFMILVLNQSTIRDLRGVAYYRDEFNEAM
jgi:putative acetyltransferase